MYHEGNSSSASKICDRSDDHTQRKENIAEATTYSPSPFILPSDLYLWSLEDVPAFGNTRVSKRPKGSKSHPVRKSLVSMSTLLVTVFHSRQMPSGEVGGRTGRKLTCSSRARSGSRFPAFRTTRTGGTSSASGRCGRGPPLGRKRYHQGRRGPGRSSSRSRRGRGWSRGRCSRSRPGPGGIPTAPLSNLARISGWVFVSLVLAHLGVVCRGLLTSQRTSLLPQISLE